MKLYLVVTKEVISKDTYPGIPSAGGGCRESFLEERFRTPIKDFEGRQAGMTSKAAMTIGVVLLMTVLEVICKDEKSRDGD